MSVKERTEIDSRLHSAVVEIQELITKHVPTATFAVGFGDDPEGVYLTATVDVDDPDDVVDLFIDRLLTIQIDEGLPLYVVPIRPPTRTAALLRDLPRTRAEALPH